MKHIFSTLYILTFLFFNYSLYANNTADNQLITELKVIDNDTTFRYLYLYDNSGKKVLETKYFKQANEWSKISQTEWLYDAGNCTHQIERIWKNNGWLNTFKIDYEYLNGKLATEIHNRYADKISLPFQKTEFQYSNLNLITKKTYGLKSDTWSLTLQTDYKFSLSANVDSVIMSVYQSDTVVSQLKMINAYYANGSLQSQIQQEKDAGKNWLNVRSVNWYYNQSSSQLLSIRYRNWNLQNSAWENYQRTDYEYDTRNNLITELYQHWKTMFWESDLSYNYQYDTNGNQVKKTLFKTIYHDWRSLISINYSDFTGKKANLMESKYEFWGGNTGELVSSFIPFNFNNEIAIQRAKSLQVIYAFNDSTQSLPQISNSIHTIPVYPNPSDGMYYINSQEYGVQSWIVTDLSGRVLKNHVQAISSGVIDITELPRGIYILKVKTITSQLTQKLIKD